MTTHDLRLDADDALAGLVDRSRRIGADPTLVVHGGGNTSTKAYRRDHLGRERAVLVIKGSGSDMRTAAAADFPSLWLDDLLPLRLRDAMTDEEMVAYLAHCTTHPHSRRPSIETLLHAFLPAVHVDHVHADAICALTNTPGAARRVTEALGADIAFVPYVRPGFELAKIVAELHDARAVVLAHHGLVTWSGDPEGSLSTTLEIVEQAELYLAARTTPLATADACKPAPPDVDDLLLRLRGRLSREERHVLHVDTGQRMIADRGDVEAVAGAGPATADHVLRIGTRTAVVHGDDPVTVVDRFERDYTDYVDRNRDRLPAGYAPNRPSPRMFVVPGLGCVAAGRTLRSARIAAEVAAHTHAVAARALDAFGAVEHLTESDLFDIDYWGLELYKLTLAPEPPELEGMVAIVTGAASGIGRAVARRLAGAGAHVVAADLDADGLDQTCSGIPADAAAQVVGDLTDDKVAADVIHAAISTFGGFDTVILNAGIGATGELKDLTIDRWQRSLDVNATSHFLLARRALRALERQGIGGSLVFVASKNAFAPGAGFGAYSVAKAAQVQLARIAALEGGPIGVRANVVNPDAVFGDSRLWSSELRADRAAAHGIDAGELEDFYAGRSLLGRAVRPSDVAEAVAFLVSDRSRATTGCVLTVDGGVAAAFPR